MAMETFDSIYLDLSKNSGRCRFADSGVGWKPSAGGETWTLDRDEITQAIWAKAAKGYELRIICNDKGHKNRDNVYQLDGFVLEDTDKISKIFKNWYSVPFEIKEHSLRGWNWGKLEFNKGEFSFNIQSRPAFEIPYSEVLNTNLAGKNEVAVELSLHDSGHENGVNGAENGEVGEDGEKKAPRPRGQKASAGQDQLVEMRFYVPGGVILKDEDAEDDEEDKEEDAQNGTNKVEDNAASRFYTTLLDKAEIGDVAGPTIASFLEVLHLTPRGRFDVDMYESSLRLRGKTYDYKIEYDSIKKFMLLPKPDEVHMIICMGLDPPLRQGQTRYPFLVMQFKRDEEVQLDLNITDEQLNDERYKGKLQRQYEAPAANVLSAVYRGLAGKKVIMPSKDFSSVHRQAAVKCSIKANEGHLYCLDKSFLFVPKPATYIAFDTIAAATFSRVGGALAASRTFDVTIKLKEGRGEHQFSNVNREEQGCLEDFLKLKGIKVKNEMMEDHGALLAKALKDESDSDDEVVGADRGSADEDEESADDDFDAGSDSDVAEEFDSQHDTSGGSDDDADADDDDLDMDVDEEDEPELVERPKKKAKK